jgi:hypothetical protein
MKDLESFHFMSIFNDNCFPRSAQSLTPSFSPFT